MKVYDTKEDILSLVRSFEDATVSRDDWKHREHLVVALYYVSHHDLETALDKMRAGLMNLLENGFKVDLSKEMPYHETMTVFWMRTVAEFNESKNGDSIVAKAAEMIKTFEKDYPLRFYSRQLLFSDKARVKFIEGDLEFDGTYFRI
jgi:hypothetical protein